MTGASPATAPARRFPAEPASAAQARHFVTEMLIGADAGMIDDARLLVSELVTNAVLHARSEVEVRIWARSNRVHVRVTDAAHDRRPVPRPTDPDATTGRGLQLVECLASSYGVDVDGDWKSVWFEIWTGAPASEADSAAWTTSAAVHGDDWQTIRLIDLPTSLSRAAQRHRDAMLRECKLHALIHGDLFGISRQQLLDAETAHDMITEGLAAAQAGEAGQSQSAVSTVQVSVPVTCQRTAAELRQVLDLANAKAREGLFLTRPALPEILAFREWLLDQIIGQLGGSDAAPWSSPNYPDTQASGDLAWHLDDIQTSPLATLAANDDNILIAANGPALELLGWAAGDLIGRRITTIIPPALRDAHTAAFTNFLLTGESRIMGAPVDVDALRRDGTSVPIRLQLSVRQASEGRAVFLAELTSRGR